MLTRCFIWMSRSPLEDGRSTLLGFIGSRTSRRLTVNSRQITALQSVYVAVVSRLVDVIPNELIFLIGLDVFVALLGDGSFGALSVQLFDIWAVNFFVEDQLEFDFLRKFIQLEFAVMAQVRRREKRIEYNSIKQWKKDEA